MYAELKANAAIIRVVGIFEEKYSKKLAQRFQKIGFKNEELAAQTRGFLKNNFYPEFRDLMFLSQEDSSAQILQFNLGSEVTFQKRAGDAFIDIPAQIQQIELFLFPNGLHFFAIQFDPQQLELRDLSD